MKKLILSLFAAGFAASSFAHGGLQEGSILLYGVGTYGNDHGTSTSKFGTGNANTTDNPRMQNWTVSPGLGYSITDCFTVGIDVNYNGTKTTYDTKTITVPGFDQKKTYDLGVGPFVRMTCPLTGRFFTFTQFEAHYNTGRETYRTVTAVTGGNSWVSDNTYKGFDMALTPAVGVMLTKSLGLTFAIGGINYGYNKWTYSPYLMGSNTPGSNFEGKDNKFNITFGQQVNFGIQKYFGGHHSHHMHGEPMDESHRVDGNDDDDDNNGKKKKKHEDE